MREKELVEKMANVSGLGKGELEAEVKNAVAGTCSIVKFSVQYNMSCYAATWR